jgi:dethiobiotin synthetase
VAALFVTGTDTGVGKTVVSCALARGLRDAGIDVGVMKPVETGVPATGPEDALALMRAAGTDDPLDLVCPLRFAMPAAPEAAAAAEPAILGSADPAKRIEDAYARLAARHAFVLVEGAGGLLVPFDAHTTMADLALRLGLPILLVARASLGTINHTLLSLEACATRGLEVAGVVVSHATGPLSEADARNLDVLRRALGDRLVGEVPPLSHADEADPRSAGLDAALRLAR